MKMFKILSIALAITCLFGMVKNSEAAEITSLYASAYIDFGNGSDAYAWLSADTDIYGISFSVKQTYPVDEADDDWIPAYSNMYATGTRTVSVNLGTYDGSLKIAEYAVKAEVWFYDADGNPTNVSDTDTCTFSLTKHIYTTEPEVTPKKNPSVSGYAQLSGQYYDGRNIVMSCYVYASNSKKTRVWASSRFRHVLTENGQTIGVKERDDPLDDEGNLSAKRIGPNFGDYSNSDSLPLHVGTFDEDQVVDSDAYVRLVVSGNGGEDHYLIQNTETFTEDDNK